jgi:O-antigen ligase
LGTLLLVALLPLSELWRGQEEPVRLTIAVTLLLYGILTVVEPGVHGFAHPRFQGQFLAITAPVVLFAGDFTLALFAAPALAGGILNGSRALMATLVGIVIVALVPWAERRRRLLPALAGLGVAVALVVGSGLLTGVSDELAAAAVRGTSDTGRLVTWAEVLRMVAERPFLGVGPGLTALEPGLLRWAGHPHNVTLTVLGEVGVVGLLLTALILVQFVRTGLAAPPRLRPWILAVVAALGHGQLSGTFVMPGAQVALAVVAGVILAETTPPTASEDAPSESPKTRRRGWILVALGGLAVAILVATLDLPMSRPASPSTWAPRFWIPGVIPR